MINKERCVLVPQVMQAKVRQSGIIAQPCPYLVYRGQRLASTAYERMVIFAAGSEVFKDGDGLTVEGDAPYFPTLAELRRNGPVTTIQVKVLPPCRQSFI